MIEPSALQILSDLKARRAKLDIAIRAIEELYGAVESSADPAKPTQTTKKIIQFLKLNSNTASCRQIASAIMVRNELVSSALQNLKYRGVVISPKPGLWQCAPAKEGQDEHL